jgi:hypothetical protein
LNKRSQGQDLGSPSGQAKFIAHYISLKSTTGGGARGGYAVMQEWSCRTEGEGARDAELEVLELEIQS